jgi:peroxiredoxin
MPTMIGAALVIVVAFSVFGYLALRGNGSHAAAPPNPGAAPLVDSSAWNPNLPLRVGTVAPPFTLSDDTGFSYSLAEQRGHPVVLEFFALWCPHCHAQAPVMHKVVSTYSPKGVTMWAVLANQYGQYYETSGGRNVDLASRNDVAWYASTYKVNYPMLIDPKFKVVNRYGQAGYPTIFIIDPSGKIAYVHSGQVPFSVLSKKLAPLLAKSK